VEVSDEHIRMLEQTNRLLRDLIIVQLALAGVGQREIRAIAGCSLNDVNRIAKLIRKTAKTKNAQQETS
jgi:hypothetical protein